ncbi:MAG: WhiB family transcriptional regulator [Acidimicrobiia bacterium]
MHYIIDEERRWEAEAACRGMDPSIFFPLNEDDALEAVAVCRACPVRDECLSWALDTRERFGVWGGTTEKQRRSMLRRTA